MSTVKLAITDTLYNIIADSVREKSLYLGHTVDDVATALIHRGVLDKFLAKYIKTDDPTYGPEVFTILRWFIARTLARIGFKMLMGTDGAVNELARAEIMNTLVLFVMYYYVSPAEAVEIKA